MISTIFWKKPASSEVNVHFFCGIQKSFPTRTTTNKPFLRPRQRSLAVKKEVLKQSLLFTTFEEEWQNLALEPPPRY